MSIFLRHSADASAFVERLRKDLREHGIKVSVSREEGADRSILTKEPGGRREHPGPAHTLVVVSAASVGESWVDEELAEGVEGRGGRGPILLVLGEVTLPSSLRDLPRFKMSLDAEYATSLPRLLETLRQPPKTRGSAPMAAWFLGPKAEHADEWSHLLGYIFQDYVHWRRNYFPNDGTIITRSQQKKHGEWLDLLTSELDKVLAQLKNHFPFYSPRYLAHMLSEQSLPSVLGYFAGMLYNPNNVTREAAPVTVRLELEVGKLVAEMLGYSQKRSWAHLSSGGTIANVEALWIGRASKFVPFALRWLCKSKSLTFQIKLANKTSIPLAAASDLDLISLPPNESLFMSRKLVQFLVEERQADPGRTITEVGACLAQSEYNVSTRGLPSVLAKIGQRPIILVSSAAHYSIKKAANVLGYGEESVRTVPVDAKFRIDVSALRDALWRLPETEYVACVIGIVGTTEEGAVDPIHEIVRARQELCDERNRSFWLHADAAWGGYIRSLFCGHNLPRHPRSSLDEVVKSYVSAIEAQELVRLVRKRPVRQERSVRLTWADYDVYKSFLAMSDADSITVDPHKMGYVPYPAGLIAYRNGLVTELISQTAPYIADAHDERRIDEPLDIRAVGPYVLEGSKPGAAAAACWLAHTTIPLTVGGHGKIVRTTLLNAKKLWYYLLEHKSIFLDLEAETSAAPMSRTRIEFTFVPLSEPDTNVVCFVAVPMAWRQNALERTDASLKLINQINIAIHKRLSIPDGDGVPMPPYAQAFFVSKTWLDPAQYPASSVGTILSKLGVLPKEYVETGVFVLRSTVMNPFYYAAERQGTDFLRDFVKELHNAARLALAESVARG